MVSALVLACAVVFVSVLLVQSAFSKRLPKGAKLLPGPPGRPLVGNLLDIPPSHSWLKFKEWADQYGPIYRLSIAGKETVVVSTAKVANDLLRDRGNIYSSREQLPMASELLSGNLRPLLLPYNDVWRNGRKLMHHLTMTGMATSYQPTQILESSRLLRDLIREPSNYERWFERYSSGLIFRLGYGKTVETGEESYIKRIIQVVKHVERIASPGAYMVDAFPVLMWLPKWMAPFKKEAERLHQEELSLFKGLQDEVREEMRLGRAGPSFTRTYLEKKDEYGLSDDEAAYVIGTLFEAGSGTTAAAMMSWMLCMVMHPEWFKKLQEELDQKVGDERLPDFEDMPNLPTVRAVVKEVLRWRPVTAGGVPHQLIKDDVYNGYFLPAGTTIHANQWAIHRDPELYPDPEVFNPSRWLDPKFPTYAAPLSKFPNLQNASPFGFGRRICPGQSIAERSLYLLTSRIACACDVTTKRSKDGVEIRVPEYDYITGFNTQPRWFPFDLKVRSQKKADLVEEAWQEGLRSDPLRKTD